uniref:Uncharacterized protein n=1 Tax=Ananas comosus var. bracteatus TaxID=296719 RepID=A0A6V7QAF1_ANACO|nr:unnamed protein product [Ananas comosus var. bracteatus]
MADRDEPLYAGLRIPRAPPILGRLAEPLVLFDGVRSKSLTVERRLRVAAFTSTHYINHGEEDVVLLEPLGVARERDVLESLGVKILHDHPSWYGFKTFGDRTDVDGLKDWVNDVIAQYKTQLVQAEILGEGWVHEVIDMRGRSDFPEEVQEWIISLRHSVLPLRLGGSLYAQPYNPHRFARQFGLDQHFPKSSDVPREAASTGVLAGYWLDLTQIRETSLAYSRGASSPTPKGIVEELPLPTLKGFTLPIPRDTVGELPSPAPIEVEQILPLIMMTRLIMSLLHRLPLVPLLLPSDRESNVLPTFASSARLVTAEENLDLLEKELETCLSSQNSLRQNLEQYSSEFACQENEMAN